MSAAGWWLLPTLVVRTASFPWHTVDRLALTRLRPRLDELVACQAAAGRLARQLVAAGRFPRGVQARLRNRRPLPADAPVPAWWRVRWNTLAERVTALRAEIDAGYAQEARTVQQALDGLAADPWFQEAVCCSSPAAFQDFARGVRTARLRRQVAAYAQRFGTKCETMSFFGPINYGRVEVDHPGATTATWSGSRVYPGRRAFLAARGHDAIQQAILDRPGLVQQLVLRRKTWHLALPTAPLVTRLVTLADGRRTVAELAATAAIPVPVAVGAAREAVQRGLAVHQLSPPSTVVDPLAWVTQQLAMLPQRDKELEDLLAETAQLLAAHPGAAPVDKVAVQHRLAALVAGLHPAGRDGAARPDRFYNDRVIVHEAAVGTLQVTVRGPLATDLITTVPAALALFAHDAIRTRELTNTAVARRLGPGRVPLVQAIRGTADEQVVPSRELSNQLAAGIAAAPPDCDEIDLAEQLAPPPEPTEPVLCSVDVFVDSPDLGTYRGGQTRLVLGDVHDAPLLTPWALQFHPQSDRCLAERDVAIQRTLGDTPAMSVIGRRTTGLPPLEFPGPVLELGGTSARPDTRRIGLDELVVDSDGERVALRHARTGERLYPHNGELDQCLHTALALPRAGRPRLPDLPYVPRLRWRNVILSRRRWRLPAALLRDVLRVGPEPARLAAVAALRASHGVPDRFFAKSPQERKPVFVDSASPVLLDVLAQLAGATGIVDVFEVLPSPDRLWLRSGEDGFAAELRCVYGFAAGSGRR